MTMEKDRTPGTLIELGEKQGCAPPGYNEGDGLMVEMLAACISNQIQVPMGRGVTGVLREMAGTELSDVSDAARKVGTV